MPTISEAIDHGVPEGAGEAPVNGPLRRVQALAVGSGRVWVADVQASEPFASRIDGFDLSNGVFLPPQLGEEAEVSSPTAGLAVGLGGGVERVYAGATREGQRVLAVYRAAEGKLESVWTGAATAAGSFSGLTNRADVAVDGSGNPETTGDVYVATGGFEPLRNVVDVLAPGPGGEEPASPVAEIRGTCPAPDSSCSGEEVVPFGDVSGVAVSGFNGDVLVTDHEGVVDVFRPTLLGQYEFVRQLTGTPTGAGGTEEPFSSIIAVATDASNGDTYVADEGARVVDQFSSAGEYEGNISGTPAGAFHTLEGVAVKSSAAPGEASLFIASYDEEARAGFVDVFGPSVVLPDVRTQPATSVTVEANGDIRATLSGSVNPHGAGAITSCGFVWGTNGAFGSLAECEPKAIPNGEGPVPVTAPLDKLSPDTSYSFRLQAGNANGQNPGDAPETQSFTTPGPGLHAAFASQVSSTSANLNSVIDPHGAPTSFFFEYGTSTAYEAQIPSTPQAIGETEGDVELNPQHLQSLIPSTVYHYRLVAVSALEVEGSVKPVAFATADETFTTQAAAGGFTLPDARQWQLVSPPDKHGALILPIGEITVIQASASGDAFSYVANVPTEDRVNGNDGVIQQYSTSGLAGWNTRDLTSSQSTPVVGVVGDGGEFRAFSTDLRVGLDEPLGAFSSKAPEAFPPDSEQTSYLRHNSTCAATPATCFQPLLTTAPGYANVPEGIHLESSPGAFSPVAEFVGATPELQHVILASNVALSPSAIGPQTALYEWSAASPAGTEPTLVSVLPDETATTLTPKLGLSGTSMRGAVSKDGSRVVWSELGGHLYLRDVSLGKTVLLDAMQGGSGQNGANPVFQLASADGSRVLFTDTKRLTKDSHAGTSQPDLYACEIRITAGQPECQLTDLTAGAEAGDVQGTVIGASGDASTVYFAANAKLAADAVHGSCDAGKSPEGAVCNVYVSRFSGGGWGAPRLVSVLSGDDFPNWSGDTPENLTGLVSRVSADGRWLAFMSDRGLTGYDTRDAVSGHPDEEVYVYDDTGTGSILCASCDPTGARPEGVEYAKIQGELVGVSGIWPRTEWIAANIPGWTAYRLSTALYAPRSLSSTGRVFFNTAGALVPRDINRDQDVYQFEPGGVGDCASFSTSGGVVYAPAAGGCVGLISSGRASGESALLDASETGGDVFFLTGERLTLGDVDNSLDVYDAHACSAAVPCLSEASQPPPCTTADSCRTAPTPQPSVFGFPASAEFHGPANLTPTPAPAKSPQTNRQKLAKALQSCRKRFKHAKRRRWACQRQAHRRYPTSHAKHVARKGTHR